jgi:hypothetical protein
MFRSAVEVLTYPTISDRGRLVPDYTATPTAVQVPGVDLQPGASTELVAQRNDTTAIRWSVYVPIASVPAGVEITEDSIVRVPDGEECQVDGRPSAWVDGSPLDHLVVLLKAWDPQ